ncbi:MAG: hypothetical protein ACR2F2_13540 [Pyrinomonadaceae bacterium]
MPETSILNKDIIYRAIRASSWTNENKEVSPTAFMLRENDEGQLSVLLKANCEARICAANFNKCYGEILLRKSKLEELGLEIKPDPILPDIPDHAVILNLPLPENFVEAEQMATRLVEIVEDVNRKSEKYGKRQD